MVVSVEGSSLLHEQADEKAQTILKRRMVRIA